MSVVRTNVAKFAAEVRSTVGEFLGEDDSGPPVLPEGLPDSVASSAREGAALLIDYQGNGYAQFYLTRLKRFVGRHDLDQSTFADIARLMAMRMSYEDPIRISQLKLDEYERHGGRMAIDDVRRFRLDELIPALPEMVADPVIGALEWVGWLHKSIPVRFSTTSRFRLRRLRIEASLRRFRLKSVRYQQERAWVERWLHMIDRALTKQPAATAAVVDTATMVKGHGDAYWQGLKDWHLIIDSLAKPTFDGKLGLADLAGAIAEARAAAMPDPRQASLKRKIDEIKARHAARPAAQSAAS